MTSIGEKVAHVRTAKASAGHHCHWPGCNKQVKPALWGCKAHWYRLPAALRSRIWQTYRPGQEDTKTPSREYAVVAREAREWILANHPPEATLL